MSDVTISGSVTTRQTVRSGDTLTIDANGFLHTPETAVEWDLSGTSGLVRLYVEGAVRASSGVAIDTAGTADTSQNLLIDTQAGSSIRAQDDVLRIGSPLNGGSIAVDNRGLLKSYGGSVIDAVVSGTPSGSGLSPFYLLNYASGTIQSDSGIAIRLSSAPSIPQFDGYMYNNNLGTILSNGKGANAGSAIDTVDLGASFPQQLRIINGNAGSIIAVDADAIHPGDYTEITNLGGLIRAGGSLGNDGIDIGSAIGVSIRNDAGGEIRGVSSGISGNNAATIENSGQILGRLGAGIDLDTAPTAITTIVNHATGVIRSYGEGGSIHVSGLIALTNDGVLRKAPSSATVLSIGGGTIENAGSITGYNKTILVSDGHGGAGHGALTLHNSGTITIDTSLIYAGSAIDIIGNFNDTIVNTGTIFGDIRLGGGNDNVVSGAGQLTGTVHGEDGDDIIDVGLTGARVWGGDGNDTLTGRGSLYGDGGNDHIVGLVGGSGYGKNIFGGDGNDIIETPGDHRIDGGSGYDTVILHAENRASGVNFQRGTGSYIGDVRNVEALNIIGTQFDDIILIDKGGTMDNKIYGGDGNDSLSAGGGINLLNGGAGDDHYLVESTTTKIVDESGDDFVATKVDYRIDVGIETVSATLPDLTITGNWQSNRIWGSDGSDTLYGMGGYDLIGGNAGDDTIDGGAGTDTLYGNDGNDTLIGDGGRDYLSGGAGNDRLIGGVEFDHLIGGEGSDVFEFGAVTDSSASEADLILDFSQTQGDVIDIGRIDAAATSATDDAFLWLGTGAFTGQEGELRYEAVGGNARVEGDVDGDGNADFAILLRGIDRLSGGEFLL